MTDQREPADQPPALAPEDSARLIEFARACKAAARAVTLYPDGHPAIGSTLGRIAQLTSTTALPAPLHITVMPDTLRLDDRPLARPEAAVNELATLLHDHLIGQIVVHPGGDVDAWRSFLRLIGRPKDEIRAEGGIARVWTTMAGRHVELTEIDYTDVLREREGSESASWDRIVANCLQGKSADLDEAALEEMVGVIGDAERLGHFISAVERNADSRSVSSRMAALLRLLQTVVERIGAREPKQVDTAMENIASGVGRLSPEMLMSLLALSGLEGDRKMVNAVVERMSDDTIATFVARNVVASGSTATDRLAQVFQTLVPDSQQRPRLLALAREDVAASPLGNTEGFEEVWNHISQKLLASYSDQPYVSEDYGRELSTMRTQALEVEQTSDDPPERVSQWLNTVATTALRGLDLALLLDLLRIEQDEGRWGDLMTPVAALLEDLLLVGDFESAQALLALLVKEASGEGTKAKRQHAMIAIDLLVEGSMLRHIVGHLGSLDDAQFERVKAMCVSVGIVLVRPLAEMLAVEERPRTRERLTAILVAFGAVARKTIERLKASTNAPVRRTAIYLMREFAGSEALPDLTELLGDHEPQVQREAVRAILNVGTNAAYQVLQKALTTGTEQTRDAIMKAISSVRDAHATPLFIFILQNVDHRGPLSTVYLRAIESLGALKDSEGVKPLTEVLYKGEWWAPGRTRTLRTAAATALARIGNAEAIAALEQAAANGSRGVRSVARPHVANARRRQGGTA
jgi:hypothetical protein